MFAVDLFDFHRSSILIENLPPMRRASNIELTRKLFECMGSRQWLNDEVINAFMAVLQVLCHPSCTPIVLQRIEGVS